MDYAKLINGELKYLDRWLKSNNMSINAETTQFLLFSYNENVDFLLMKIGNNKINETAVI